MEELTQLLHHVTRRYRSRLLTRLVLHALLGAGLIGLLAWRLQGRHVDPGWSVGAPLALAVLGASVLAWELRRRWISARDTVGRLDQQLGLQQRLVTAAEFAHTPEKPALYPILLDDVARRYQTQRVRLPRPWDRASAVLAVMVLLLLLWPGAPPLMRLAQWPAPTIPPPQPPVPTPPEPQPQPQSQEQQDQSSSAQQNSSTSPSAGQGQSSDQQQDGGGSQQGAGGEGQGAREQSQGRSGTSPHSSGAGEQQPHNGSQGSQQADARQSSSSPEPSGASGSQQRDADAARQSAQRGQSSAQAGQKSGSSAQQASGQQGGASQGSAQSQQAGEGQQQASAQRTTGQSQQGAGAGGSMSPGNQEMLKAQIQELLKEVSGELKQLQEQLASAQGVEQPQAGTSTDPDLYGGSAEHDQLPSAQRKLPMQLHTDTGETKQPRSGGGAGQPSQEVGHAAPQAEAQDAQLSDVPLEERPTERQPIPPEYRSVFDQLRNRSDSPSEAATP